MLIPLALLLPGALPARVGRTRSYRLACGALLPWGGLTACTHGPSYKRPDIEPPKSWPAAEVSPASSSTIPAAEPRPPSEWWRGFDSSRLNDLLAQARLANGDLAAARAAFFPSIDRTADGGLASVALTGLISPVNRVFAISAGITQAICSGGQLSGAKQLRKARDAELLSDYHKTVIAAFTDVDNTLLAVQQTADQYRRQQDALAAAGQAYEITQTQMRAGTVNILMVLNTQSALFKAQDLRVQIPLASLQSLLQLYNALGAGGDRLQGLSAPMDSRRWLPRRMLENRI